MYYQSTGSGPPLLLLHGFTGSTRNWEPVIPLLAKSHTVIAVDLPGHGNTQAPADIGYYQMQSVAPKLVDLMAQQGHDQFDLLGYSMGGRLALYLAVYFPKHVSNLILESASPGLKTEQEREARRQSDHALAHRIEKGGIEPFVDFWESISLWESQKKLPAQAKAVLRQIRLDNHPTGLANSLRGMGTGAQPSLWPFLTEMKRPTLLLTGKLDGKFCSIATEMVQLIPSATHTIIDDAGHTIHLEQRRAWLKAVTSFLIQP